MGLFGKKKEKIVDWSKRYRVKERKAAEEASSRDNSNMEFLGNMASSSSDNISWDNDSNSETTAGEYQNKKTKLARRLLDMTNKIEDLNNQIYHLKQRIELLEKKLKISMR
jgi:peptidoglycan hydrolase CwlO-like protein